MKNELNDLQKKLQQLQLFPVSEHTENQLIDLVTSCVTHIGWTSSDGRISTDHSKSNAVFIRIGMLIGRAKTGIWLVPQFIRELEHELTKTQHPKASC